MPALKKLLERLDYQCVQGNPDIEISHLIYDSRKAGKDDLFVCIKGTAVDGHKFVGEVAQKGAAAIVVQEDVEAPDRGNGYQSRRYPLCLSTFISSIF